MLVQPAAAAPGRVRASPAAPLRQTETALIRQAVQDARGNVAEAARALGISRATVYRKLGRVINQFRWCDGVATAQANHTMDATR